MYVRNVIFSTEMVLFSVRKCTVLVKQHAVCTVILQYTFLL